MLLRSLLIAAGAVLATGLSATAQLSQFDTLRPVSSGPPATIAAPTHSQPPFEEIATVVRRIGKQLAGTGQHSPDEACARAVITATGSERWRLNSDFEAKLQADCSDHLKPQVVNLATERVTAWIEARERQPISIKDLIASNFLSREALSALIGEHSGSGPNAALYRGALFEMEPRLAALRERTLKEQGDTIRDLFIPARSSAAAFSDARRYCALFMPSKINFAGSNGPKLLMDLRAVCERHEAVAREALLTAAITGAGIEHLGKLERLAVASPSGDLQFVDIRHVFGAAALQGYRLKFSRAGWMSHDLKLNITRDEDPGQPLQGRLSPWTRADGVKMWKLQEIESLSGLDGPLATVACLMFNDDDNFAGMLGAAFMGAIGAHFNNQPAAASAYGDMWQKAATRASCLEAHRRFFEP